MRIRERDLLGKIRGVAVDRLIVRRSNVERRIVVVGRVMVVGLWIETGVDLFLCPRILLVGVLISEYPEVVVSVERMNSNGM